MKIDSFNQFNKINAKSADDVFDLKLQRTSTDDKMINASIDTTIIPFTMITISVVACGRSVNGCK